MPLFTTDPTDQAFERFMKHQPNYKPDTPEADRIQAELDAETKQKDYLLKVKGGSEKRRWSKKSIGNKAAEEEKICSVEKVGEKGKESAFGKIERIEKLE